MRGWEKKEGRERFGEPEENRGRFKSGGREENKWIIAQEAENGL